MAGTRSAGSPHSGVAGTVRKHSGLVTFGFLLVVLFGIPAVERAGYEMAALLLYVLAGIVGVRLLILAVRELQERLAAT